MSKLNTEEILATIERLDPLARKPIPQVQPGYYSPVMPDYSSVINRLLGALEQHVVKHE